MFLVGPTGRTGRHLVTQAISRGHRVTALVRRPRSLDPHPKLQIVVGDPPNVNDLVERLLGHDAVVSCLGQRSQAVRTLLQNAAAATLEAMSRTWVRRCLVVSQASCSPAGTRSSRSCGSLLARHVADSTAMERRIRASETDRTIVRPPRLLDGSAPHGYRVAVGAAPAGTWAMQRADLAAFLLDAIKKHQYSRTIVGITSA